MSTLLALLDFSESSFKCFSLGKDETVQLKWVGHFDGSIDRFDPLVYVTKTSPTSKSHSLVLSWDRI